MTQAQQPFIQLFEDFQFNLTIAHLAVFHEIPNYTKRQGKPFNLPDELCWMTYENHTKTLSPYHQDVEPGIISVTQNTQKYLSNDVNLIHTELTKRLPRYPWDKSQIHFMRTRGDVLPHAGGTRSASLNIGLLNSSAARTDVSMNGYEGYDPNNIDLWSYVLEDGVGVLLDVLKVHSVYELTPNLSRYQITYGFDKPFDEVLHLLGEYKFESKSRRSFWNLRALPGENSRTTQP